MPSKELSGSAKVTAFSFRRREKGIAGKGMENECEENLLRPYSKIFLDSGTRTESGCSFDSPEKTDCAGHVFSDGTIEHFDLFDDLHTLVGEILRRTECDGSRTAIPCSATGSRSLDGFWKLIQSASPGSKRVKYRCAVCGALRRAWAGQAEDGITDSNQSAAFTLHALFSPAPQTRQGHYRRLFPIRPLWNRHHRNRREDARAVIHFQGHGGKQIPPWRTAAHRPCEVGRIGVGERLVDKPGRLPVGLQRDARAVEQHTLSHQVAVHQPRTRFQVVERDPGVDSPSCGAPGRWRR